MLGDAGVQPGSGKQLCHGLHPLALAGLLQFTVNDADGGFRVKAITVAVMAGGNLDERIQQVLRANLGGDVFLAVHAVHQAHDRGAFGDSGADGVQCTGQCPIFQRDDQKISPLCLLRRPDDGTQDFAIDCAALAQTLGAAALGNDAELNARAAGKPPNHVGADSPGPQQCNFLNLHRCPLSSPQNAKKTKPHTITVWGFPSGGWGTRTLDLCDVNAAL